MHRPPQPRPPADTSTDPVLVLGAGPVGQTTALLLARRGVPVRIVDARPERDAVGSKAICQQRDVLDVWDWLGGGAIAAEGLTWDTARTFYRDDELFDVRLPDPGSSPLPTFVNISQSRTEEILDDLLARAGVSIGWNHEVTGIDQDDDGVTVECATPQGRVLLRGTHAVSCLGSHGGVVRKALGVDFAGTSFDDRFLICDIRADLPGWARERRFWFDPAWNPGRQVLIHPCPGSTFRIDWQVPGDYDLAAEERSGALHARVRAIVGEAGYEILWKSVYRFHARVADRLRVGRVLLAGDCAHLMSPFGARGLNSGVGDAENAAWKLAYVLRGWAGESLLDSYHAERHAAAVENLEVTTATMNFLVPHDGEQRALRESVLAGAATDPALRARVDSGRFSEPFWYVASPLTTPDVTRPFAGRPPRGRVPSPGPGILVPDVPVSASGITRLRQLLRDGFCVLAARGAELPDVSAAPWPVRVLSLPEFDREGVVADTLGARDGELWLVRPDAYAAAVVTEPTSLVEAMQRAVGGAPTPASA